MTATYRETAPPQLAAPWLAASWRLTASGDHEELIVPDGCIDLVWRDAQGLLVVGANTSAFTAAIDEGPGAVGVRFRPGGAAPLLGLRGDALRDAQPSAREVLGDDGARLDARLYAARDGPARERELVEWVLARARGAPSPQPIVAAAAQRLAAEPRVRLPTLCGELAVSERQLRRYFVSEVGYGPKLLGRVLRLRRALARARAGASLAEAAAASGYSDQAHFTNDCGELAGVTPAVLLRL